MRKSRNTLVDTQTTDNLEVTRRLYRGTTEVVKRLDEQKASALTITDILTPSGEVLRCKLKDYCERLIFKDPVSHARKIEELLWRKAFYDVVSAAKKLRKGNVWKDEEKALLCTHLAVGVGFYHHLILRLQLEYDLDLAGVVDFAYQTYKSCLSYQRKKSTPPKVHSDEIRGCVMRIVHRSLICLGDLARYKLDLEPNWDPMIATRYYKMAIVIDRNIGMPHNQLGTVSGNKNYGIDAVYHYMRCILCPEPFEGADGNLKRIIAAHVYNGKEKSAIHRCAARLFTLLRKWNSDSSNTDHISEDCQNLLIDIENCLNIKKIQSNSTACVKEAHSIEEYLQNCKSEPISYLSSDIVFKIIAICLMSISKLQTKESRQVQGIIAFTLSLLSQLIQVTIDRIQEFIMDNTKSSNCEDDKQNSVDPETLEAKQQTQTSFSIASEINNPVGLINSNVDSVEKIMNGHMSNGNGSKPKNKSRKNLLTKLRRPRKRFNSSDSDGSDMDGQQLDSSSEELNSDISETEEEDEDEDEEDDDDDVISECSAPADGTPPMENDTENDAPAKIDTNGLKNNQENIINGHDSKERNEIEVELKSDNEITTDEANSSHLIPVESAMNLMTHNESPCERSNGTIGHVVEPKKQDIDPNCLFDELLKEELFYSIKVCFDWLRGNPDIIRMVTASSRTLLQRITILINLINVDPRVIINKWERDSTFLVSEEKVSEYVMSVPLQEDIELRGLNLLQNAHEHIDWQILRNFNMRKQDEVLLRILKLVDFGNYLCLNDEVGMAYDKNKNVYSLSDGKITKSVDHINNGKVIEKQQPNTDHPHGKLMRHMGKLWLKAEVRALESRLKSKLMSPYLVPDHEALAKHTPALKRLVYTKKFIIIIPSIVISALDEMKRTSSRVREATRWLEGQLQKGSRFLRAQRPHESLALPLIKGPRAKDKDAWLFFQIIECCHYLTQQTKVGLTGDTEPPVVTLLTGITNEERKLSTFSPNGLAKSAGVNLEHIESFHTKWKTSSKSHG